MSKSDTRRAATGSSSSDNENNLDSKNEKPSNNQQSFYASFKIYINKFAQQHHHLPGQNGQQSNNLGNINNRPKEKKAASDGAIEAATSSPIVVRIERTACSGMDSGSSSEDDEFYDSVFTEAKDVKSAVVEQPPKSEVKIRVEPPAAPTWTPPPLPATSTPFAPQKPAGRSLTLEAKNSRENSPVFYMEPEDWDKTALEASSPGSSATRAHSGSSTISGSTALPSLASTTTSTSLSPTSPSPRALSPTTALGCGCGKVHMSKSMQVLPEEGYNYNHNVIERSPPPTRRSPRVRSYSTTASPGPGSCPGSGSFLSPNLVPSRGAIMSELVGQQSPRQRKVTIPVLCARAGSMVRKGDFLALMKSQSRS